MADLNALESTALAELAVAGDEAAVRGWNTRYFGDKGLVKQAMAELGKLPKDQRATFGQQANKVKVALEAAYETALAGAKEKALAASLAAPPIDVTGTPFQVELFRLSTDPHDQERFRRRVSIVSHGRTVYLPTPEDVVITKLLWAMRLGRSKDSDDIRDVLSVQQSSLDWDYIHKWCAEHQTRELLDRIRQTVPTT